MVAELGRSSDGQAVATYVALEAVGTRLRKTPAMLAVLEALLEMDRPYGQEVMDRTDRPSGTIYPILARLERVGWVDSAWEDPSAHEQAGRPRRRFYRLTSDGADQARAALSRAHQSRTQPSVGWGFAQPDARGAPA
jgi:PadR family transcriptional regulator PadR